MSMRRKIKIQNSSGIHIRTAAELANLCENMPGDVKIMWKDRTYDGKSIIELLDARIRKGDEIILEVTGKEEDKTIRKIEDCILRWR